MQLVQCSEHGRRRAGSASVDLCLGLQQRVGAGPKGRRQGQRGGGLRGIVSRRCLSKMVVVGG